MKTKAITLAIFNENNHHDKLMAFYIRLALIIIIYMLLMISFIMLIDLDDISFFIGIPGIIFMILLLLWNKRRRAISLSLFIGLSFIILLFLHSHVIDGCLLIMNAVIDFIGIHTGIIILPFDLNVTEHMQHTALHITLTYIGLLMAYISYNIVVYKRAFLLWSIVIILFILQTIFQREMFTFINLSLLFISLVINRKTKHLQQQATESVFAPLSAYGILLSVAVLLSVSIVYIQPKEGYEKPELIEAFQRKGEQFINDVRFEPNKTNTFTNGDFQALGPLALKDEVALEVTMDEPTPLYLRGFTGSEYTRDEWKTLDSEVTHAHRGLLYWLNEEDFHPLNQLGNINELIGEKEFTDRTTMTIRNVNANRQYVYTPYELTTKPNEIVQTNIFNDQMIASKKWFGERTYTFETYMNLTSNYPTLANKLYSLIEEKEIDDYIQLENHYNAFVQKVYTNIPEDIRAILEHHVTLDPSDEQDTPYEEAIHYIRHYLHQHMAYTTRPKTLPEGKDFLLHFLEDTKEGYATHFATAATLMFRYLDIPARYVEGYLLLPQDVEDVQPGEKIYIKGANAHAWSEIYVDQIGWIPVEMTPPYFDKMPSIDTSNYPEGTGNSKQEKSESDEQDASGTRKVKEDDKRDVVEEREDEQETTEKFSNIWLLVFIVLIVLVIITYLLYLLKKKIALRKVQKSFNDPNVNKAIHHMFLYMMSLMHYDGIKERGGSIYRYINDIEEKYGSSFASQFQQVIHIHQKAHFSQDEVEQSYYDCVNHFISEVIKYTYKSKGWLKRLKMKWIDVIV